MANGATVAPLVAEERKQDHETATNQQIATILWTAGVPQMKPNSATSKCAQTLEVSNRKIRVDIDVHAGRRGMPPPPSPPQYTGGGICLPPEFSEIVIFCALFIGNLVGFWHKRNRIWH